MDEAGRVMIFSCAMALDRMQFSRADMPHPESEVDAVVGMHWLAILPYSQKVKLPLAAHGGYTDTLAESYRLVGCAGRKQVEVEYQTTLVQQCAPSRRRQSIAHLSQKTRRA